MARIEKTVFISYRRRDISWALAVYQYLTSQKYDVFFDYTSLSGGDFEQVIVSNIKARAHFVLILTPTALDRTDEPGDWLRREIETAIDEKRNIIPLFFDGFNFGSLSVAEKLTGKLSAIRRYNGLDIPSGYFMEAMERLSIRYLNIPLDAVIHPVSTEVLKVVQEEQIAADKALLQKSKDIKDLVQKGNPEKGNRAWIYGRLIVVILFILGLFGPWVEISACSSSPTLYKGADAYVTLFGLFPLSIIPVALVALFLFTLMRLLPWRFAANKTLVRLERLAAGIAPISLDILPVWLVGLPWLWGFWTTMFGVVLAPVNILLELNSMRQKEGKWPMWAWLLTIAIILSLSILLYSWIRFLIAQSTP